jgi:hypothetical protein
MPTPVSGPEHGRHPKLTRMVTTCAKGIPRLYPSSDQSVKSASGKIIQIGKDHYINRLVMFCESKTTSGISLKVMSADLKYIGERLDAVFSAAQKGSHAEINLSEAQRFVIHTYLLIGDILDLNAEASRLG